MVRVSGLVAIGVVALGCGALLPVSASAQDMPGAVLEKSGSLADAPVAKMVGRWRGEGWSIDRSGQRITSLARERAHWNMAGTAIIVEGLGTAGEGDNLVVGHDAFGLVEMQNDTMVFYARRAGEEFQKFAIEHDEVTGNLRWRRGENVRFTITLTDMTWIEIGEYSTDGGNSWTQFLGMELHKVADEAELRAQKVGEDDEVDADSAMSVYRRAQALMKEGRREEGYRAAQRAMQRFVEEGNDLAWMLIESIELEGKRIDVHFNMGSNERTMADGIVRPMSFRVWDVSTGDLVETIDFEFGVVGGKPMTAALGKETGGRHDNFGTMPVESSYEDIRAKLIELVRGR